MLTALARAAIAGLGLSVVEVGLVLFHDHELFLSRAEIGAYLGLAPAVGVALALVAAGAGASALRLFRTGAGVDPERAARRARWAAAVVAFAWALPTLLTLTSGRRVRDLPGRLLLLVVVATACAWVAAAATRWLLRARAQSAGDRRHTSAAVAGFGVLAVAALALDAWTLRRLYPAFHDSLAALAVGAALAASAWPASAPGTGRLSAWRHVAVFAAAAAAFTLPLQFRALARAPNARFAIEASAPLTGKALRWARALAPVAPVETAVQAAVPADTGWSSAGVDLRGQDVLLVTIDALRADRLRALGGSGVTPRLDALAEESVVFRRAYTATPHTSYALSSLMTAKYIGSLARLGGDTGGHVSLPSLLRAHGYRTAAFYPPSIFFVDAERFAAVAHERFGFEYTKVMFATAHARVAQLEGYLAEAPREHPVFAWVHLFEPHEPYDPPEEFRRGDSPEARYDGEVATADDAAGALVAAFRRARPGATIIVTSDHGEEFGDHGGAYHGTTLYDEQVRVPILWSSAGVPSGVTDRAVGTVDIATTLLAALGIPRDARMRGSDLGSVLAGQDRTGGGHAFSSIEATHMVTDGRHKLICEKRGECRLFDLESDPRERDDLALRAPQEVASLRGVLAEHEASISRVEALSMQGGGAWPEALARARLGGAADPAALVPLLGDGRAGVRAAAAREVGEGGVAAALPALARMRSEDAEESVRAEAALAALGLGDATAQEQVRALLDESVGLDVARRASLVLAELGDRDAAGVLARLASDASAEEAQRSAALRALGRVGGASEVDALLALLGDVRLRPEVAMALAGVGDRRAVKPLLEALTAERYPTARGVEARALMALGERRRATALVRRFLGTESSVPGGVGLLLDVSALSPASGAGADLRRPNAVQRGPWECGERGCRPLPGATLVLPTKGAPVGDVRVILRVDAEQAAQLLVANEPRGVVAGLNEIVVTLPSAAGPRTFEVESNERTWLTGIAVVTVQVDIPPPAPKPWAPDVGAP